MPVIRHLREGTKPSFNDSARSRAGLTRDCALQVALIQKTPLHEEQLKGGRQATATGSRSLHLGIKPNLVQIANKRFGVLCFAALWPLANH